MNASLIRCFLLVLLLSATSWRIWAQATHVPGELIVMLAPEVSLEAWLRKPLPGPQGPVFLQAQNRLSPRLNLHLLRIDPRLQSEEWALRLLRQDPQVQLAQLNHYLENRGTTTTFPSDPDFGDQWNLHNQGQGGGTVDADIDAPEAWDITTGGVTALGDTIVVAVIDRGFELSHPDLHFWKNHHEIPGDGLDNDNNGYFDDVKGWNPNANNDQIPNDPHGTHVAGIVAARGNNGIGVSGVNWNCQIMAIVNVNTVEAEVVAGYAYALEMRRLYDQSGGSLGAYVVATNTSFGIDFGNPANFPIWCAMYDSLGQAGIISAAATMNLNENVDVKNDMPTACGSDWLITVTNTNRLDARNTGAAFGATTIDLGAPGSFILSTGFNQGYDIMNGTSMSSPHVAGSVALLHASACPGVVQQYKVDPANMALVFKNWIMQSVDTLPSLQNITVTGGRLNLYQAILAQQADCASYNQDCLTPFQLNVSGLLDTAATLSWADIDSAQAYHLRYRQKGDSIWQDSTILDTSFLLGGLAPCTEYEFQVESLCGSDSSGFLSLKVFRTEGCCEAPGGKVVSQVSDSSAQFNWRPVFGANAYRLRLRPLGVAAWDSLTVSDTTAWLDTLAACTAYEWQLGSICDSSVKEYGDIQVFSTVGCGFCLDTPYCGAKGEDITFEWIEAVQVGPLENKSGKNGGYAIFSDPIYQLALDSTYAVSLQPGYQNFEYDEFWRIWIDLDQDGMFNDSTELVLDRAAFPGLVKDSITLPLSASTGLTRMRVAMKFEGIFEQYSAPTACETFEGGEVEDYCVLLLPKGTELCTTPQNFSAKAIGNFLLPDWNQVAEADSFQLRLKLDSEMSYRYYQASPGVPISIQDLDACSVYTASVQSFCAPYASGWSAPDTFLGPGCTDCPAIPYCIASGNLPAVRWIESVALDTFFNSSGADSGYGKFDSLQFEVFRKQSHFLSVKIGSNNPGDSSRFQVWIDWEQDGSFEQSIDRVRLNISDSLLVGIDSAYGFFRVPEIARLGITRMRVVVSKDTFPEACGTFWQGEVEDYCLKVNFSSVGLEPPLPERPLRLFPNPTDDVLTVSSQSPMQHIQLYNLWGQLLQEWVLQDKQTHRISLRKLPPGVYLIRMLDQTDWHLGRVLKQ